MLLSYHLNLNIPLTIPLTFRKNGFFLITKLLTLLKNYHQTIILFIITTNATYVSLILDILLSFVISR